MNEKFLKRALQLARENIKKGGGPFAAVIVKNGLIISEEGNRVTLEKDPTAHAEILAIRKAAEKLGSQDLSGCELYSSCEPCPMCLGAVYWSHIGKVYFAATHEDAAKAGFDDADIYCELEKPSEKRRVCMESAFHTEGVEIFQLWDNHEDKKLY